MELCYAQRCTAAGQRVPADFARADEQTRDVTLSERKLVADLVEASKAQKSIEDKLRQLGPAPSGVSTEGPGDVFIKSKGFQAIRMSDMRPQQWSSGPIEVIAREHARLQRGGRAG
jgi:hypothetical protein